ncbi:MAG: hypothetical protein PHH93_12365 [Prolixibacteraceae bacterium]|nr:hypothetical protein [Prolixibacteraceae bacterium]
MLSDFEYKIISCLLAGLFILSVVKCPAGNGNASEGLRLSTFDVDATPPVGSALRYQPMINDWD